jgi:hypothetical protein
MTIDQDQQEQTAKPSGQEVEREQWLVEKDRFHAAAMDFLERMDADGHAKWALRHAALRHTLDARRKVSQGAGYAIVNAAIEAVWYVLRGWGDRSWGDYPLAEIAEPADPTVLSSADDLITDADRTVMVGPCFIQPLTNQGKDSGPLELLGAVDVDQNCAIAGPAVFVVIRADGPVAAEVQRLLTSAPGSDAPAAGR